ncbi:mitochondrial potassium channel [Xylocopa sonorina]|uniref:mitochondrial potassium channel n=1 Tax=Xylocopa sonorina TaxID=1818115 RepID=UPI00403A9B3B
MAEKFRSLMRALSSEINKHQVLNNASVKISNVTDKAQKGLNNVQTAVAAKYNVLAKQVSNDITVIQNLNSAMLEPTPLPKRVVKWMQWYQQLTGLDTVEIAKQQVISAQDKLFSCQDERRRLNREATLINEKLKDVYSELIQTKRDDPKYVQLTIVENKNLQDQARITSQLNLLEREEKDHFTLLATAIKEYHDSQTMNAQKYKYLSILASAILAVISLAGSMVYNNKRIVNVRSAISEAQQKNESMIESSFQLLQNDLNTRFSEVLKKLNNNSQPEITVVNKDSKDVKKAEFHKAYIVIGLCALGMYIVSRLTG